MSCNVTIFADMSKQTIDLSGYISQAEYARINDIPLNTLSQWISRMKKGQKVPDKANGIKYHYVAELNMTLVKK